MRSVPRIRIFLSSPGDVADERRAARLVIERLRTDPLLRGQVDLDPIDWSDPDSATPMLATMTPQEAINRGLAKPSESDIVIVIFWARMGTPLPPDYRKPTGERYLSGTEWEYEDAVNASKIAGTGLPLVVIYRRDGAPTLPFDAPDYSQKFEQWQRVEAFFAPFANPDGSIQQGYNRHTSIDDFTRQIETHLKNLIKQVIAIYERRELPSPPVEVDPAPLWQGSPFPGLRAFTPADEPIYFGRGMETDALVKRLREGRLIAVVGASGSGKSSLVGAGLLPRLSANTIEGSKDWLLPSVAEGETRQWQGLRFTPSEINDNPFDALAAKLAPLSGRIPRTIAAELSADPARLLPLIDEVLGSRPAWAEALLFIDQFEELFTLCARHHRAPFIALLATVAGSSRVRAVLTLRADFYANAVEDAVLAGLLEAGTFPLSTPGQAALYGMITRPAAQAGLDFEDGLAEQILNDTGDDPGALALLAYALDQLYRQSAGKIQLALKDKTQLTRKDYEAVGGVQGAIGDRAEAAFRRLAAEAQATFATVFRDLVEVDERGEPTRRRAALDALTSDADARALIDRLTDERLLVTNRTEAGAVVEVAHEALLRSWDRLRLWITDQTRDLQLRRRLEGEARAWAAAGTARQSDFVLLGSRLEEAERWMSAFPASADVRALISASAAHRADQIAAEEQRKQALIAAGDQARRAIAVAIVLIFVVAGVGIFALIQTNTANRQIEALAAISPGATLGALLSGSLRVNSNSDWTSLVFNFGDGVPMVLVPPGCFMMGSADGDFDEQPVHEQCVDEPFYIDQTEVTQADFERLGGVKANPNRFDGDQRPVERITWSEARDFCILRGARLPTERQWEYAARGPDARVYPWGNAWDDNNAVWEGNSNDQTANVGTRLAGASWVGALDMSGNVWEWTSSLDEPYPYLNDGSRERDTGNSRNNAVRVVRGGSWDLAELSLRGAARGRLNAGLGNYHIGFRCARSR